MDKPSQNKILLKHFEQFGTITPWEAIKDYGIIRLPSRICELRKIYNISDEWIKFTNRYGNPGKYKKYKLEGIKWI